MLCFISSTSTYSGYSFNFNLTAFRLPLPPDRPNWQDWGGRWVRRNAFMRYLKAVLEELNLTYTMPVQPVIMGGNGRGGRGGNFYSNPGGGGPGSMYSSGTPRVAPRPLRDDLGNAGLFQGSKEMIMSPTAAIAAGESQWKY